MTGLHAINTICVLVWLEYLNVKDNVFRVNSALWINPLASSFWKCSRGIWGHSSSTKASTSGILFVYLLNPPLLDPTRAFLCIMFFQSNFILLPPDKLLILRPLKFQLVPGHHRTESRPSIWSEWFCATRTATGGTGMDISGVSRHLLLSVNPQRLAPCFNHIWLINVPNKKEEWVKCWGGSRFWCGFWTHWAVTIVTSSWWHHHHVW